MKIKICGITRIEDALLCSNLGVDAIGFVFYKNSKRYIDPEQVRMISNSVPPFVSCVGVFVNEEFEEVNRISKYVGLNYAQLHGTEPTEYIGEINVPVIKGFGVDNSFDFKSVNRYRNCKILLDVKDEVSFGGTGKTFDWELIPSELRTKVIIAGGISTNNIETAYESINPAGLDLSSSIEVSPGIKDESKLREVMQIINKIKFEKHDR